MLEQVAKVKSMETHASNRAVEHLMGILSGVIADGDVNDLEVRFLSTWLSEHAEATETWPGSLVQRKVRAILTDGVISEPERAHLLEALSELVGTDFSLSGSVSPETAALSINDVVSVNLTNAGVCLSGQFLYGTRAACERATLKAGATCYDKPSRNVDYLVIGTRVSPFWAHTSFGRKIQRAVALQETGHPIEVISERRWIEALGAADRDGS